MAGFVVVFEANSLPQEREGDFHSLLHLTAQYKGLELPSEWAISKFCTAAKLDGLASRHLGMVRHESSGSWLLAAGTIITFNRNWVHSSWLNLLLYDYLERGLTALGQIDGHFALVIFDGWKNRLHLVSDPTGMFSMFWAQRAA